MTLRSSTPGPEAVPPRLSLREFEHRDRDAIVSMHADIRVRELLVDDFPLDDPRVAHAFIERMQAYYRANPGLGIWCAERWVAALSDEDLANPEVRASLSEEALAMFSTPVPCFVGWFNLMRVTDLPQEVEIGCRLIPEVWGSGLVHDGGERLLDKAFLELGLPRVWGICHPQHRSVRHVLRTLGFRHDGDRPCSGVQASWFVIDQDLWMRARAMSRRQRMRAGLERNARSRHCDSSR
jgi:RimJ/RimL family protein N-acetyltransferase